MSLTISNNVYDFHSNRYKEIIELAVEVAIVAGSSSSLVRDLRSEFVQLAITDGHVLKDIASSLYVCHETVKRLGKG